MPIWKILFDFSFPIRHYFFPGIWIDDNPNELLLRYHTWGGKHFFLRWKADWSILQTNQRHNTGVVSWSIKKFLDSRPGPEIRLIHDRNNYNYNLFYEARCHALNHATDSLLPYAFQLPTNSTNIWNQNLYTFIAGINEKLIENDFISYPTYVYNEYIDEYIEEYSLPSSESSVVNEVLEPQGRKPYVPYSEQIGLNDSYEIALYEKVNKLPQGISGIYDLYNGQFLIDDLQKNNEVDILSDLFYVPKPVQEGIVELPYEENKSDEEESIIAFSSSSEEEEFGSSL